MAASLILLSFTVKAFDPSDCLGEPCSSPCYSFNTITCDTECSPSCTYSMINDFICQPSCQVPSCGYDSSDCHHRKLYTTVTITNTSMIGQSQQVLPDNYGLVAGVGLGVFLTIMAMILGIILCVIGTATSIFFVFLLIGILIPLITFLIVAFAPLHKNESVQKDTRTDQYFAARLVFLIFIIIFSLLAIVKLFEYYLGINLKAKGVNSNISKISSADLISSDGPSDSAANNPLAGPSVAGAGNPLLGGTNPSGGNPLVSSNPFSRTGNPVSSNPAPVDSRNPLFTGSRNPLSSAPEANPLAPPTNPLLRGGFK